MKLKFAAAAASAALALGVGLGFGIAASGMPFVFEASDTPIGSFMLRGNIFFLDSPLDDLQKDREKEQIPRIA